MWLARFRNKHYALTPLVKGDEEAKIRGCRIVCETRNSKLGTYRYSPRKCIMYKCIYTRVTFVNIKQWENRTCRQTPCLQVLCFFSHVISVTFSLCCLKVAKVHKFRTLLEKHIRKEQMLETNWLDIFVHEKSKKLQALKCDLSMKEDTNLCPCKANWTAS